MMYKRKKIMAVLLTVCLVCVVVSNGVFALTGGTLQITYESGETIVSPVYGETVKVDVSGINGIGDMNNIVYKWRRHNGIGVGSTSSDIPGATSQTYTLTADDIDSYIEVRVSELPLTDYVSKISDVAVGKIVTPKPVTPLVDNSIATTYTTINIETIDGQLYALRLTSDTTSPLDFNVTGNSGSHQFTGLSRDRSYNIYTEVPETATNASSEISEPLVRITDLRGTLGLTYLDGSPVTTVKFGETLKVDLRGISNPSGAYTYKWSVDSQEVGTDESYEIVANDVGKAVVVTFKCSGYQYTKTAISSIVEKADRAAPEAPSINSVATTTLSVNSVSGQNYEVYTGMLTPQTGACVDVKTGDGNIIQFTSLEPDSGYAVYTMINETSTHKASEYSLSSAAITGDKDLRGTISISHDGAPQYGETLTADITGVLNRRYGVLTYQWQRDGSNIGINSENYVIDDIYDIGEIINVKVTSDVLDGYLESTAVTPQKGELTIEPPVVIDQTEDSITIETVANQNYAIRLSSSSASLDYNVTATGANHTFTGLSEDRSYNIYTMLSETASHNSVESQPVTAYLYAPMSPVKNIVSFMATDTINNVSQSGVHVLVKGSAKLIIVIVPVGTPLGSIRIDYVVENGTSVTGLASGSVVDFSAQRPVITLKHGSDSQEWAIVVGRKDMLPHQITKSDVTSYGGRNGSITMVCGSGAVQNEYSLDSGSSWQLNNTFSNLGAGTYTMQVRKRYDTTGEKVQYAPVIISQPGRPSSGGSNSNHSNKKESEVTSIPQLPVPVAPVVSESIDGETNVSAGIMVKISGGIQTAEIDKTTGKNLVDAAKKAEKVGGKAVIEIKLDTIKETEHIEVALDRQTFKDVASETKSSLKIKHNMVDLQFDSISINTINRASLAGAVKFSAEKVSIDSLSKAAKEMLANEAVPVFDFTVTSGSKQVSDFGGGKVTISIPFTPSVNQDTNAIVVYLLTEDGLLEPVVGRYNPKLGRVDFSTNHFSKYLIGYNLKEFEDVDKGTWFYDAVTYIAARAITDGKSEISFAPEDTISRAEFITLVVRYFDLKSNETNTFSDVDRNQWYTEPTQIAKAKGILPSMYGAILQPDQSIDREEMMYILYKALEITGQVGEINNDNESLKAFEDFDKLSSYAQDGAAYLISKGIINGNGDGTIAPDSNSTRAEVAQMIYNLAE